MPSPISLSQLSGLIQDNLRQRFAAERYWVLAEISNHSFYPQKGFHYFDLVEKSAGNLQAKLAAVAWTAGAARILDFEKVTGQKFQNGISICLELSIDFHPVYGLKCTLIQIDPAYTLGKLELAKLAVIEKLLATEPDIVWLDGDKLMSFNQQLLLQVPLQKIALVGSGQSAGLEDFLHSLRENRFGYTFQIDFFDARVQGEENAAAIAAIFEAVLRRSVAKGVDYDAIVLIRGGGASTDLLLFDQYETALAIAAAPFPVLTGIGHQKNLTLTDQLAHTALKTPTKVAEMIVESNREFESSLLSLQKDLIIQAQQLLASKRLKMEQIRSALVQRPSTLLAANRRSLLQYSGLLKTNSIHAIRKQSQELLSLRRLFRLASPERTLERGFAWIEKEGKIVADPNELTVDDLIRIRMNGIVIDSHVETKKHIDGSAFDL